MNVASKTIVRIVDALLRRTLPPGDRGRGMRGDLLEEHEERRAVGAALRANLWLIRQGSGVALRYALGALSPAGIATTLALDGRAALRGLRASPLYALAIIGTLGTAVGLGAVTYGVLNAVVIAPLPYPDAANLFMVVRRGDPHAATEYLEALAAIEGADGFAVYEYPSSPRVVTEPGAGEQLEGINATPELFEVLRTDALHGRTLRPEDAREGAPPTVLLSHAFWTRRFAANPTVVDSSIDIDQVPHRIVGVMPAGFAYPAPPIDYWAPLPLTLDRVERAGDQLAVLVRLRATTSPESVATRLEAVDQRPYRLVPRKEFIVGDLSRTLLVVFGAAALLIVVACTNVAAMAGAREARRSRAAALRRALGASRWRIAALQLIENGLLTLAAAAIGLALSRAAVAALPRLLPQVPRINEVAIGAPALAYAAVACVAAMVALTAAQRRSRAHDDHLVGALRGLQRGVAPRIRRGLAVAQVAAAVTLVVAAALLARSFAALEAIDPGFAPDNVLTFRVSLPRDPYIDSTARFGFFRDAIDGLVAIDGVRAASMTTHVFSRPDSMGRDLGVETDEGVVPFSAESKGVGAGYFDALGIELVEGRLFGSQDRPDSLPVAIVGAEMARRLWPDGSALGRRLKTGGPDSEDPWLHVVGVVEDVKSRRLTETAEPEFYLSYEQGVEVRTRRMYLVAAVEPGTDALDVLPAARNLVAAIDPSVPLTDPSVLDDLVATSIAPPRTRAVVMSSFALLTALLATLGVYGITSLFVSQRTAEFAIRQALGATRWVVFAHVVGFSAGIAATGIGIGIVASLLTGRLVEAFLYGVVVTDLGTYVVVAIGTLLTAMLASLPPIYRATRSDPAALLQED